MVDNYILRNFEWNHKEYADRAVEVKEYIWDDLIAMLDNGRVVIYDSVYDKCRELPANPDDMTEEEWRREFGIRLRRRMCSMGVNQMGLSELADISQVMVSKYTRGDAVPGAYNLNKIAKVLDCHMDDFVYAGF